MRFEDSRKKYAFLSHEVILNPTLSLEAKGVYGILCAAEGDEGIEATDPDLNHSDPEAKRAIAELHQAGVIEFEPNDTISLLK